MDKVKDVIKKLVSENGLPYVADLLGETTTRNIENWIKPGKKVPSDKVGMIKKLLIAGGHLDE